MHNSKRQFICRREELDDINYLLRPIVYRQHKHTAIIFNYENKVYAYVNYCMHMQRPLDFQEDTIFDSSGKLLRCSMHGFVFEPTTGVCLSPVCEGQKLQAIKLVAINDRIYFTDKNVNLIA